MRRLRTFLVSIGVFYLMFFAIPWASADGCDFGERLIARVLCPVGQEGYIYVCQDLHSGVPLVHHHCKIA